MPHPEILRVLGMTPQQWGALPPDVGDNKTSDRSDLKRKAYALLAEEKKGKENSIEARLTALEAEVFGKHKKEK